MQVSAYKSKSKQTHVLQMEECKKHKSLYHWCQPSRDEGFHYHPQPDTEEENNELLPTESSSLKGNIVELSDYSHAHPEEVNAVSQSHAHSFLNNVMPYNVY